MHHLEGELETEKGQKIAQLYERHMGLLHQVIQMDSWESKHTFNEVGKKVMEHINEEFQNQISREVTKKVNNITGDIKLKKKLTFIEMEMNSMKGYQRSLWNETSRWNRYCGTSKIQTQN